jgi:hypothetical protein
MLSVRRDLARSEYQRQRVNGWYARDPSRLKSFRMTPVQRIYSNCATTACLAHRGWSRLYARILGAPNLGGHGLLALEEF